MPGSSGPLAAPVEAARAALAALAAGYRARYGAVVFEVDAWSEGPGLVLGGRVLLPAQREAALAAAREASGLPVADRLVALTEDEAVDAWLIPALAVLDVRERPGGELSTQLVAGDPPARRLGAVAGSWVVELADGTVGWVEPAACLELAPRDGAWPGGVAAWREAWRGHPRPATEADWRAALAPWWGAPYRWGGCTPAGVDCSGLSQRLYKQVLGLGLPKHSGEQLRQGARVGMGQLRTGDLVGLRHLERRIGHVAVVLRAEPVLVAHASLERGVSEEPLGELAGRYQVRGARRFV